MGAQVSSQHDQISFQDNLFKQETSPSADMWVSWNKTALAERLPGKWHYLKWKVLFAVN